MVSLTRFEVYKSWHKIIGVHLYWIWIVGHPFFDLRNMMFWYVSSSKSFVAVLLFFAGATIQSSLNDEQTATHAALLSQLALKAASVVETLDMSDELTFLRLRSRNREVMIAPDKDYLLVVIQNPNATE